ncbi:unnamed protein product [Chrysoparadoxa australica]
MSALSGSFARVWSLNYAKTRIIRSRKRGLAAIARTLPVLHGHDEGFEDAPTVEITWKKAGAEDIKTDAKVGMNLMRVAHMNDIDLEGACEGVCACSTCHVVLQEDVFDSLPEASEEEEDMLDQAFALTDTSRLGCQVIVTEDMAGIEVELPAATRNFYVDGHKPTPH